jgi:large subunit ribosomal protein L29
MNKSELLMKEINGQTVEKLSEKLVQLKKELFNLRFQKTLGELKNTSRFLQVRKGIARLQTELTKRRLGDK